MRSPRCNDGPATIDRRHTPNSGWARIAGLKMLHDSTLSTKMRVRIDDELLKFDSVMLPFITARKISKEERA